MLLAHFGGFGVLVSMKASLRFDECAIVLYFTENYSFVVHGFHWRNSVENVKVHFCVLGNRKN